MRPDSFAEGSAETLLSVQGLSKSFFMRGARRDRGQMQEVRAVNSISFDLRRGETLGLVGESGSGKTTAARTILRALTPTGGRILFREGEEFLDLAGLTDRQLKPLRSRMQMIFQDPFSSLNPRMTVGDIVAEPLIIHRVAKGEALKQKVCEMLLRAGLKPEHRTRYPHAFSGGQRQRIGIARALILNPDLIVADEAVSALDVSVQAQIINLLEDLQEEFNLTTLFIAHDLGVVRHICDRVAVMYCGRIVEMGSVESVFSRAAHPYTRALLASIPHPDPDQRMKAVVAGETVDPAHAPDGCSFYPRCPHYLRGRCDMPGGCPPLKEISPEHWVACCFPGDPAGEAN